MYALFTDSDTDIVPAVAKEYGYNVISMPYAIGEKEVFPYVDFEEFDAHEFYDQLRHGVMPTTSALSPKAYVEYFEPFFAKGEDVLYVHFSAAMSGTFNALALAEKELAEKYPDRKIYKVDTKGITIGSYNIVREIGQLYKDGKSIEEILDWAKEEVDKFAVYFFVEDLSFFGRSGRISNFSSIMGNIFGVRPILTMGADGKMASCGKASGRNGVLKAIMNYVETLGDNVKDHRVVIGHADYLEVAQMLGELVKAKYGDDTLIEYVNVNPTAGSHCGPNTVGISFHAIHR